MWHLWVGFDELGVFSNLGDPAVLRLPLNPKGDPGSCAENDESLPKPLPGIQGW